MRRAALYSVQHTSTTCSSSSAPSARRLSAAAMRSSAVAFAPASSVPCATTASAAVSVLASAGLVFNGATLAALASGGTASLNGATGVDVSSGNAIAVTAGGIRHPGWTAEEHAAAIKRDIDRALDLGYQVVASSFWDWDVTELAAQLSGLSAANRAPAIYKMLHDNYQASPVFYAWPIGGYHELQRR